MLQTNAGTCLGRYEAFLTQPMSMHRLVHGMFVIALPNTNLDLFKQDVSVTKL